MKPVRVLLVDDEPGIRQSLRGVLSDEGYEVHAVDSGEACLEALAQQSYDVVLLDIWLPGMDGMETLTRIQEIPVAGRPVVVMISGHGTIETAVRATKLGAFDFLEKPLTIQKVSVVVKNAAQQHRLSLEIERLKDQSGPVFPQIIGNSVPMKALRQQLALMASTNGRVLIFGESGTGKELIARAIHASSTRASEPFVEVNCAAIPEDLIESELFGHVKGSFAGAEEKIGKFRKADGGTLFLDEVGDMSLRTQAKVLRVLDEQRFEPVGASEWMRVDVRVVAATNKNLEEEIERGNFREDLFYRLNVIPFSVPPLRERREDIPVLANYFLEEFTRAYRRNPKELTPAAYQTLRDYNWPGNIRELRNVMERLVIMHLPTRVDAKDIPLQPARRTVLDFSVAQLGSLQEVREAAERDYILRKLDEMNGNMSRTAELLGLERSHLYRKMKALGIAREPE